MANLNSAITTAVSGLNAQGTAIAALSQNISNADTNAYKSSQTDFASLVTGSGAQASGVVTATTSTNITAQGSINSTAVNTNIAIQGSGFFVVTNSTSNQSVAYNYTRDGEFTTDQNGFLVNNEGQYLLGQPTDSSGLVTVSNANSINSLVPVSVSATKGSAKATSALSIGANLPADAAFGASFSTAVTVYDALGISSDIVVTWTKDPSTPNVWNASLADPVLTSNYSTSTGSISPNTIAITFNGDGSIATPTSATALAITWTTGASNSTINLNLGTPGKTDQLSQFTSTGSTPNVSVTGITQDGVRFGKLTSITVDQTGLVTAKFDNGLKQPVFQIPLATFPNANGLTHVDGSVYQISSNSGSVVLQNPNQGSAGSIVASAVEGSNTDTTTELSKLVVSQQAYSASSKVISTVSTMYNSLLQAIQ